MIPLIFTFWLTFTIALPTDTYSRPNLNVDVGKSSQSQTATAENDEVPYGPEPMCGGSKEVGDRWCY